MVDVLNDLEEQRFLDGIHCMTYREIWDEMIARMGDGYITRQWISKKLHRDENWVRQIWNKITEECYIRYGCSQPMILTQENKNMVASASGVRSSSFRKVAKGNF